MISVITTVFETVKNIGYYSFYLSFNTGKVIVAGLLTSYEVLNKLLHTLWTVLVILNEDFFVFLHDVWNRLSFILGTFNNLSEYIIETIVSFFSLMKYLIFGTSDLIITICHTVINIITKVFTSFGSLIAAIKQLIVLFGSGVWFAITIVPIFIVYSCMMVTYCIGRAFEETKSFIQSTISQISTFAFDFITFVTDVPLESIAGLAVCACIVYAIVKFHITLFNTLHRFARPMIGSFFRHCVRARSALSFTMSSRRRAPAVVGNESSSEGDEDIAGPPEEELRVCSNEGWITKKQRNRNLMEDDNRLCIICMERNKCILAMPCRHMCTCSECNDTLRNYQHTCPICRRYINYTIHVY